MILQLLRKKKELTFTRIDEPYRLEYEARSWTEGEESAAVEHVNELELSHDGDGTVLNLRITINEIGPGEADDHAKE